MPNARRLLIVAASISILLAGTPAAATGATEASQPNPLRRAEKLRVRDIASASEIVAIGWQQGRDPGRLMVTFSKDGGASFLKNNGNLRKFANLGSDSVGLALDVCGRKGDRDIWTISASRRRGDDRGDSDVVLTRRDTTSPMRDAYQSFITSSSQRRSVRDVDIACVGNRHLAIAWLEKTSRKSRARLMIRSKADSGEVVKLYNLGTARLRGGISVAVADRVIHVVWIKNDARHLRHRRFIVGRDGGGLQIAAREPTQLAWRDVMHPELAARGKKVVVAYSDAGKVQLKLSTDHGESFSGPERLIGTGTIKKPSRAYSVALSGDRIVVEAMARKDADRTPQRLESVDLAESWVSGVFGHHGKRVGVLERIDFTTSRLREAWHNNGARKDSLRAQVERP